MADSFRNVSRLVRVEIAGLAFANCTEPAVTSADVAAKHERGRAIRPALENVWTAGFLTNRVQVEALDQLEHLVLISRIAQPNPQPFRLWLTDLLIVTDYT